MAEKRVGGSSKKNDKKSKGQTKKLKIDEKIYMRQPFIPLISEIKLSLSEKAYFKKLSLHGVKELGQYDFETLFEFLQSYDKLKYLSFVDTVVSPNSLIKFCDFIVSSKELETLEMVKCSSSFSKNLLHQISSNSSLKMLNMNFNSMEPNALNGFFTGLLSNCLNSKLEHISFRYCDCNASYIPPLTEILKFSFRLLSLDLTGNTVGGCFGQIIQSLSKNNTLQDLILLEGLNVFTDIESINLWTIDIRGNKFTYEESKNYIKWIQGRKSVGQIGPSSLLPESCVDHENFRKLILINKLFKKLQKKQKARMLKAAKISAKRNK
ncbi:hypothetical protein O9G_004704 [Rozella allomycis CSF55]|uniref:RNI-like protein n=1 Tax=Rozella allomycis (strain CSF55) TaxID=988480 RepID=A0A075AY31_ROZAC|nr:hypothetical protein O9G_004704 [Rozella allomycis CSF55]|eukprot:EPZ35225.1 hypothetical protein O9G_004704 [Rozella allomycis CSF55]